MRAENAIKKEVAVIIAFIRHRGVWVEHYTKEKERILAHLLSKKADFLPQSYERAEWYETLGRITEVCARASSLIPRNTETAERFSAAIIRHLHASIKSNPDFIWIQDCGKKIILRGIGEVKLSIGATLKRQDQFFKSERNLRDMVFTWSMKKIVGYKSVQIADDFICTLILPRHPDKKQYTPSFLPGYWRIEEIEFTFEELNALGDYFRSSPAEIKNALMPHIPPACSAEVYKAFVQTLSVRAERFTREIFSRLSPEFHDNKKVTTAIAAWWMLYGSIPFSGESIRQVVAWSETKTCANRLPVYLLQDMPTGPVLTLADIKPREHAALAKIVSLYSNVRHIELLSLLFLTKLREVKNLVEKPSLSHHVKKNLFLVF